MVASRADLEGLPDWPRGMSADQAAAYVGESKTLFLEKVSRRQWPQPRQEGRRAIWDKALLDLSYNRTSGLDIQSAPELDEFEEAARGYHQNAGR